MELNITLPCYNEEKILENNVITIFNFLNKNITEDNWKIIIADNGSYDNTGKIGKKLEKKFKQIKYFFIPQKGKGIAIKKSWEKYPADIYIFMDIDLATDLEALPRLIKGIKEEKYNITTGSRFLPLSQTNRSWFRLFLSQGYKILRKIILNSQLTDTPCGFKAVDQITMKKIVPQIKNKEWFFDSEMLLLAEFQNFKIKEIPIKWEDIREKKDKSKVKVISLAFNYLKNIFKIKKRINLINNSKT